MFLKGNFMGGSRAIVNYWPEANAGLGHVSIHLLDPNNSVDGVYISSWGVSQGNPRFDIIGENKRYGSQAVKLELDPIEIEYSTVFKILKPIENTAYNLLTSNCAHCVFEVLKQLGCLEGSESNRIMGPLRPAHVFNIAKTLSSDGIEQLAAVEHTLNVLKSQSIALEVRGFKSDGECASTLYESIIGFRKKLKDELTLITDKVKKVQKKLQLASDEFQKEKISFQNQSEKNDLLSFGI